MAETPVEDSAPPVSEHEGEQRRLGAPGSWLLGVEDLVFAARTWSTERLESGLDGSAVVFERDQGDVWFLRPSIAADVFPVAGLSVGLELGYDFVDRESQQASRGAYAYEATSVSQSHLLRMTPRIGYALQLPSDFGLWARVGATNVLGFDRASQTGDESSRTQSWYALGLEGSVLATYSPGRFLAVFAGPGVYRPLWAQRKVTPESPTLESDTDSVSLFVTLGAGVRL